MTLSDKQFGGLFRQLQEGGFSADAEGNPPTEGFMVSQPGTEVTHPVEETTPTHLKSYAAEHKEDLGRPNAYQGGWRNSASVGEEHPDELDYLDVSHNHTGPAAYLSAMDAAVSGSQLSMYDVKKKDTEPNKLKTPTTDPEGVRRAIQAARDSSGVDDK